MNRGVRCRGAVLPVVLAVALAVSLMLAGLLQLPFAASRYALREAKFSAETYLAESALIMHLSGFPQGFFADLPPVRERSAGPWLELRAGRFVAFAGKRRENGWWPMYADWVDGAEFYRQTLLSRVQSGASRLSGNRRFFEVDPRMKFRIENGDLTVNADGNSEAMSFYVEGSAVIKGNLCVDSLWLFANGPVSIAGNVRAEFVEIYSAEDIRFEDDVTVRGHIWGRLGVQLSDRASALFPSVVLAMGSALSNVSLAEKSKVEGVLAAPNGRVEVAPSALWDSVGALLPFYVRGDYVAFEERFLE